MLAACVPLALAQQVPPEPVHPEGNPLVLEAALDHHVLSDSLAGYQHGDQVFLPLGELARILTIAIRTDPARGSASGYVLEESRNFSLDLARSSVTVGGDTRRFAPSLARVEDDDIFVELHLLQEWLPVDFDLDMSTLTLRVTPRERLPLQQRLDREALAGKAATRTRQRDPGYPRHVEPYRMWRPPVVDQTLALGAQRSGGRRQASALYSAYATGELAGMESSLFFSHSNDRPEPELRVTLARRDPDAGLLGPLRARAVVFGNVALPGIPNISLSNPRGDGALVSNRPLTQPTGFDTHTLEGDLPPGWDVELYFNDALVAIQQAGPEGRYAFIDQQLIYGPNEFRLVFHGPLGQLRVERQSFLLDRSSLVAGDLLYTLAASRDGDGNARALAQFEWGLGHGFTATGGMASIPLGADQHRYVNVGVRAFQGPFIFGADAMRDSLGGTLAEISAKTRIAGLAVGASHTRVDRFASDFYLPGADRVRTRDRLRADGALRFSKQLRFPVTLEMTRDTKVSGFRQLDVLGRIAAYHSGTALSNTVQWHAFGDETTAEGAFQVSRRIAGVGVLGQLQYELSPEVRASTLTVTADKTMANGYVWNLGVTRAFERDTRYFAGLSKGLGRFGLSANLAYSSDDSLALGVQLFIATGRDPRSQRYFTEAQPMARMGAASVRVFLDTNLNGIADAGEEGITNTGFSVNGGLQPVRTDAAGVAYLARLPAHQHVDVGIDLATLEDPQWTPRVAGVRMVPRPGVTARIDIPVILTGEIDGTTYLVEGDAKRAIGDLQLELSDNAGKVVATATSASDGYYIVEAVPPGEYRLRVAPAQLKRLGLTDTGTRLLTMGADGKVVSGVDFYIIPKD